MNCLHVFAGARDRSGISWSWMAVVFSIGLPAFSFGESLPCGNAWETQGWHREVPASLILWNDFNPFTSTGSDALPPGTASISGNVWLDVDRDSVHGKKDSPIIGARVWLYSMEDPTRPLAIASTDKTGLYRFECLPAGEYALRLWFPQSAEGVNALGTVVDRLGVLQPSYAGHLFNEVDEVSGITLDDGSRAEGYNFGEIYAPTSKRMFLNPEPGTVTALLGAAACGALAWLRRRKRACK